MKRLFLFNGNYLTASDQQGLVSKRRNSSLFCLFLLLISSLLIFMSCSDDTNGKRIGVYQVEPPVTENTPDCLLSKSIKSSLSDSKLDHDISYYYDMIKDRFFQEGPTFIKGILEQIDSRMQELDDRSAESERVCLSDEPQEFNLSLPDGFSMPHYLQCYELNNSESGHWVAFGKKDDIFYVREGMKNGIGSVSKVDSDENVETWLMVAEKNHLDDMTQQLLHLISIKADKTIEFTATGSGFGFGCGVHYKSNDKYIYIESGFEDNGCTANIENVCINVETQGEADISLCSSEGLTEFSLVNLDSSVIDPHDIWEIGSETISGLTDFNE